MSDGFSAFKAMACGLAFILVATTIAPEVAGGHFDLLRITKGKGRGKSTLPEPSPAPEDGGTTGGETGGTTQPPSTTTNGFYSEETMVPSNFDISSELVSASIPVSAAPDVVGAFRFICSAGQLAYDDPIVYPGQPGKSHLHQFYGNTAVNSQSTYQSLRTTGQSTCMSPLNRSAYWMPAMLDGRGNVIRPDYVTIYYKRRPASDPKCDPAKDPKAMGICVPLPNGLKFIFGVDMLTGKAPTGSLYYNCDGDGATQGHYPDIVTAARYCPSGAKLGAIINAPNCWDGKNLDSPNHRDHVSYASYGNWGYLKCPSTHPYVIPGFHMGAWYTTDATLDRSGTWEPGKTVTWHLSSDVMPGMAPAKPGTTFHADWWGAWDNSVMAMWMDHCINKLLNCSAGNLGNGKGMRQFAGFSWTAQPKLVPIPR